MDKIILLSGPSIAKLESKIDELRNAEILFYAINRKSHVEQNILSKIGRKVDIWVLLSPDELHSQIDEVEKFIADAETQYLITSLDTIEKVKQRINRDPISDITKILIVDSWILAVYNHYFRDTIKELYTSLSQITEHPNINTLFVLLYGLLTTTYDGNIYLFGCDGAQENYKSQCRATYYAQTSHYSLSRVLESDIYADMRRFEEIWPDAARHFQLDTARVINVNPDSYYKIFKKMDVDEAFAGIWFGNKASETIRVNISDKYAHLKLRDDVATLIRPGGIGIELGVAEGTFSGRVMQRSQLSFMYGVDMYAGDRNHDVIQYRKALKNLEAYKERYSLLRMRFDEALELFPDEHFDFIYIDGYAHTGEEEGKTFSDWYSKLKTGGIFAGDDYSDDYPKVKYYVNKFCALHHLTLHVIDCKEEHWACRQPTWFVFKP